MSGPEGPYAQEHIVALLAIYTDSTLLRSGVSKPVVVAGERKLALWTRSSRLQAKTDALGSIDYKSTVAVDDGSTGGTLVQALLRRRTAG